MRFMVLNCILNGNSVKMNRLLGNILRIMVILNKYKIKNKIYHYY